MGERTLSMLEAAALFTANEQSDQVAETVIVIEDDEPVMAILPFARYQEMHQSIDTLTQMVKILHDETFMASFRRFAQHMGLKNFMSFDAIKQELDQREN